MTLAQLAQIGPIATGMAATVALVVGLVTLIQRARADRRDQWWKRAQWAMDLSLSADLDESSVGLSVLGYLAESDLTQKDEAAMLESVWIPVLRRTERRSDDDS